MLAAIGSVCSSNSSFIYHHHHLDGPSISSSTFKNPSFSINFRSAKSTTLISRNPTCTAKLAPSSSGSGNGSSVDQEDPKAADDDACQLKRSADWRAARTYKESGVIFDGKIEGFNNSGLLIQFYSLLGFLPYPLLSPSYSCKAPQKAIQEIAKDLVGSSISVKDDAEDAEDQQQFSKIKSTIRRMNLLVVDASEEDKKLIFSEKDAVWSKYSNQVKVGDIFDASVGSVEAYGAFVHLQFPDGKKKKSRITLSIKQFEEDPLLGTLDKVIPQEGQFVSDAVNMSCNLSMEPLPGLDSICKELLQEDGITDVRLG